MIGASTGYGLAARISAAFGSDADTLGVFFERAGSETKPGTAGWYNTAAFEKFAAERGAMRAASTATHSPTRSSRSRSTPSSRISARSISSSTASRHRAARTRRRAKPSARRSPIGKTVTFRGLDTDKEVIRDVTLEPATQEEIDGTVAVMGGEDWQMWIDALDEAGVLADGAKTTAFTYLGEQITHDIYWNGSIGEAKKDLDKKVLSIRDKLVAHGGDARVSVLKAVVTQASSAIPMMPLYLSLLFKTMKEAGTHEGCIEQVYGLFKDSLYGATPHVDEEGRLRADYKGSIRKFRRRSSRSGTT